MLCDRVEASAEEPSSSPEDIQFTSREELEVCPDHAFILITCTSLCSSEEPHVFQLPDLPSAHLILTACNYTRELSFVPCRTTGSICSHQACPGGVLDTMHAG